MSFVGKVEGPQAKQQPHFPNCSSTPFLHAGHIAHMSKKGLSFDCAITDIMVSL